MLVEAVALYAKTTITSRCLLHVGIANASSWPADLDLEFNVLEAGFSVAADVTSVATMVVANQTPLPEECSKLRATSLPKSARVMQLFIRLNQRPRR